MRLIDADALIADIKTKLWDWDTVDGITSTTVLKQTITDISHAPTIDAVPVRHGRWEEYGKTWWCSECGFETGLRWDYCPNCGARMDEEVEA